jgi:hypothetical protein
MGAVLFVIVLEGKDIGQPKHLPSRSASFGFQASVTKTHWPAPVVSLQAISEEQWLPLRHSQP